MTYRELPQRSDFNLSLINIFINDLNKKSKENECWILKYEKDILLGDTLNNHNI